MAKMFITYNRESEEAVTRLADDIEALGHDPWYDKELSGGQAWWDQILARIRDTDVLIVALSPRSVESVACRREYTYAVDLGKPILPVLVAEGVSANLLPPALSTIQFVDVRKRDRETALLLARAVSTIPPPGPLPEPLPDPPDVPLSYLGGLKERIETEAVLGLPEQSTLLLELKQALREPATRADALAVVAIFGKRPDLLATIARELDDLRAEFSAANAADERRATEEPGVAGRVIAREAEEPLKESRAPGPKMVETAREREAPARAEPSGGAADGLKRRANMMFVTQVCLIWIINLVMWFNDYLGGIVHLTFTFLPLVGVGAGLALSAIVGSRAGVIFLLSSAAGFLMAWICLNTHPIAGTVWQGLGPFIIGVAITAGSGRVLASTSQEVGTADLDEGRAGHRSARSARGRDAE